MKRAGTRNMYFILLGLTETEMMPCFEVSVVFRLHDTLVGSLSKHDVDGSENAI